MKCDDLVPAAIVSQQMSLNCVAGWGGGEIPFSRTYKNDEILSIKYYCFTELIIFFI